jgi:hypothetical protein
MPAMQAIIYNVEMATRSDQLEREWARQWKNAAAALAEQRRRDLRLMTDAEALAAAENLLSLVETVILNPIRSVSSGLVEQQALLHRRSRA